MSVAEDSTVLAREIYGNGEPGGLKLEVSNLLIGQKEINDKISAIYDYLGEEKKAKSQEITSFDRFLKRAWRTVLTSLAFYCHSSTYSKGGG